MIGSSPHHGAPYIHFATKLRKVGVKQTGVALHTKLQLQAAHGAAPAIALHQRHTYISHWQTVDV